MSFHDFIRWNSCVSGIGDKKREAKLWVNMVCKTVLLFASYFEGPVLGKGWSGELGKSCILNSSLWLLVCHKIQGVGSTVLVSKFRSHRFPTPDLKGHKIYISKYLTIQLQNLLNLIWWGCCTTHVTLYYYYFIRVFQTHSMMCGKYS